MLAGGRNDPGRIFAQAVAVTIQASIFFLCLYIGATSSDRAKFVEADATVGHFLLALGEPDRNASQRRS